MRLSVFVKPFLTLLVIIAVVCAIYAFVIIPFFLHFSNYAQVIHVAKADTLLVKDGDKIMEVKLIGVEEPQQNGPASTAKCLDEEARHFMAANFFMQNQDIRLIKDDSVGDTDSKGRYLRYVYLKNGDLLNEKILQNGLGEEPYDPNQKMQKLDELTQAQKEAQSKNLGVWNPQGCN